MWRQLEVDLEGALNWSAFIAGLRCLLIKQRGVSGRPWKTSAIRRAGKEAQQVIKPADIKRVPSALIAGKNICSFPAKAPNAGRRRKSGVFFIYLRGLVCEKPTFFPQTFRFVRPTKESTKPWGKKLPGKFSDGQKSFVYGRAHREFGVGTIELEFGLDQDERSADRTTRRALWSGGGRCVGWTMD